VGIVDDEPILDVIVVVFVLVVIPTVFLSGLFRGMLLLLLAAGFLLALSSSPWSGNGDAAIIPSPEELQAQKRAVYEQKARLEEACGRLDKFPAEEKVRACCVQCSVIASPTVNCLPYAFFVLTRPRLTAAFSSAASRLGGEAPPHRFCTPRGWTRPAARGSSPPSSRTIMAQGESERQASQPGRRRRRRLTSRGRESTTQTRPRRRLLRPRG
jgi:hypothetical protein